MQGDNSALGVLRHRYILAEERLRLGMISIRERVSQKEREGESEKLLRCVRRGTCRV